MRNANKSVIFLDVDFVLNDNDTPLCPKGFAGVDDDKIECLKEIVNLMDAEIVLSSSWRDSWHKASFDTDTLGGYLNLKLAEHGLFVSGKTDEFAWDRRGAEIRTYLDNHPEITRFIILDDADFKWRRYGLDRFWVQTCVPTPEGDVYGLSPYHVEYVRSHMGCFGRQQTVQRGREDGANSYLLAASIV